MGKKCKVMKTKYVLRKVMGKSWNLAGCHFIVIVILAMAVSQFVLNSIQVSIHYINVIVDLVIINLLCTQLIKHH